MAVSSLYPAYTASILPASPLKRTTENSVLTAPGEMCVTRTGVSTSLSALGLQKDVQPLAALLDKIVSWLAHHSFAQTGA